MTRARYLLLAALAAIPTGAWLTTTLLYAWIDDPKALGPTPPIPAFVDLKAERCGACHRHIYEEWSSSMMANASVNPFFLAERTEQDATFLCERCHAPLAEQAEHTVVGLEMLPFWRSLLPRTNASATSSTTHAHVQAARALVAKTQPNRAFDAALDNEGVTCAVCHIHDYGDDSPGPTVFAGRRHDDANPPHPVRVSSQLDEYGTICARCHQFDPIGGEVQRPPLDTVREYQAYREAGGVETCLGCHMPEVERPAVSGGPMRTGHDHRFRGALDGAFIAEFVRVNVVRADEEGIVVALENHAGHHIPTGEPSRVLRLTVELLGEPGVVATRSVRILRAMDTITRVEVSDNTLRPFERREVAFTFSAAEQALGTMARVRLVLARYEAEHPVIQAIGAEKARDLRLVTEVTTATVVLTQTSR